MCRITLVGYLATGKMLVISFYSIFYKNLSAFAKPLIACSRLTDILPMHTLTLTPFVTLDASSDSHGFTAERMTALCMLSSFSWRAPTLDMTQRLLVQLYNDIEITKTIDLLTFYLHLQNL